MEMKEKEKRTRMHLAGGSSGRCKTSELFSFALGYLLAHFRVPGLAGVQVKSWPPASLLQLLSVHN